MRLVLDTNIFVSALLLPYTVPAELVNQLRGRSTRHRLATQPRMDRQRGELMPDLRGFPAGRYVVC